MPIRREGGGEVSGLARAGGEVEGGGEVDPHGLPAPGYISPPRGLCEGLLPMRTKNRPALDLFCTRNRCTHSAAVKLFGGYMRERSKRQTSRWD